MKTLLLFLTLTCSAFASYVNPPFPTSKGGTGSLTQTANRAVTTDGSGNLVSSGATTSTEVGYLSGVTSAIQTQLNGKASTTLNNLGTTSINSDLLPASTGTKNLGSSTLLFNNAYLTLLKDASDIKAVDPINRSLWNTSGTKVLDFSGSTVNVPTLELLGSVSGNLQLTVPSTVTSYSLILPAAQGANGQHLQNDGSGNLSWVSPGSVSVVNGGDTAYSIQRTDGHVRSGTALTAQRTYTLPTCDASHIGEYHEVKNLASQGFNVVVAAAGTDTVDGSASYSLLPGDSVSIRCAAFSTAGSWDVL